MSTKHEPDLEKLAALIGESMTEGYSVRVIFEKTHPVPQLTAHLLGEEAPIEGAVSSVVEASIAGALEGLKKAMEDAAGE